MPRLDDIAQYIEVLEELRVKLREIDDSGVQGNIQSLTLTIKALKEHRNLQGQFVPEPFPLKRLAKLRSKLGEVKNLSVQENIQTLNLVIRALENIEGK